MISPYAIRLLVRTRRQSGNDAGYLYFVSTLGSSAGTLMTAFYLVLWFEVNTILISAIGTSLLLGLVGIVAFRRRASAA
jgi:LPXTG-motif cell wall-anchored protein